MKATQKTSPFTLHLSRSYSGPQQLALEMKPAAHANFTLRLSVVTRGDDVFVYPRRTEEKKEAA